MMTKNGILGHTAFTGQERDSETGYSYFGARYMDHELMTMWLSVDPLADKYPNISPYAYCAWNPVKLVDPDGKEIYIIIEGTKYYLKIGKGDVLSWQSKDGQTYNPTTDSWAGKLTGAMEKLMECETANTLIRCIVKDNRELEIKNDKYGNRADNDNAEYIKWMGKNRIGGSCLYQEKDQYGNNVFSKPNGSNSPAFISLIHELAHIHDMWFDIVPDRNSTWEKCTLSNGKPYNIPKAEMYACWVENKVRYHFGLPLRFYYYYDSPSHCGGNTGANY